MMDSDSEDRDDSPWGFLQARRFARAFGSAPEIATSHTIPDPSLYNPKCEKPKSLGDFDRLFAFCGKPLNIPPPEVRRLSSGSSSFSDHSTPPTSAPDDNDLEAVDGFDPRIKEVRWKDEVARAVISRKPHRIGKALAKDVDVAILPGILVADFDLSNLESDTEDEENTPVRNRSVSKRPIPSSSQQSILFSPQRPPVDLFSVKLFQPHVLPPPPIPKRYLDPSYIQPIYTLTAKEQRAKLLMKLAKRFSEELDIRLSLSRLGITEVEGIHVFVDLSNIMIGFSNKLKFERNISERVHMKQPPFSFFSLAMILERGRKVTRRVVAGSTISDLYEQPTKVPRHITDATACNYEMNILERVSKPQTATTPKKKKHGTGSGYVTSGYSSASESTAIRLAMQEQAVDELLQMKILESLVDSEKPSTIVLASGDAAEAEYSGGFLTNVERALRKGWKVEVVAWSQGLSYEYRRKEFLDRWKNSFKYINLDDYCEEMFAVYTPKYKYPATSGNLRAL